MPDKYAMHPPAVSAIVPLYNAQHWVRDTLASLRAQTLPAWEAWVIDDGSTDEGPAIVAALAQQDARIRLVRQPNGGVAAARNHGLSLARGEFVHFLDSDDLLEPEAYARLVAAARSARQADPSGLFGAYGTFHVVNQSDRVLVTQHRHEGRVDLRELLSYPHLQTVSHIIDRRALTDLTFDGRFPPYEDQDLWTRVAERGHVWITVPEPVARYRIRPGSLSKHCERALLNSQEVMRRAFARAGQRPDGPAVAPADTLARRLSAYALAYATRAVLLAHESGPGPAADEGLRLLALADGPKGWSLDDAAKAAWWQAVYGLALRPDPDRDADAPWGHVLRHFWDRAARAGLLQAGDSLAAWERVFLLRVEPELIVDRLLGRLGRPRAVTLVGLGQNGRLLAQTLRARGVAVHARDDRAPDGQLASTDLALGIVGEPAHAEPPTDRPLILTPLDDAALWPRFEGKHPCPLRWSQVHAEIIAERRAKRRSA
jgi:hypothetical protein